MNHAFNAAVLQAAERVCPTGWTVGCQGDYDGRPRVPFDIEPGLFEDQETAYAFEAWRLATHWTYDLSYGEADQDRAVGIMAAELVQLFGATEQTVEYVAILLAECFGGEISHHRGAARRFVRFALTWTPAQAADFVEAWGREIEELV